MLPLRPPTPWSRRPFICTGFALASTDNLPILVDGPNWKKGPPIMRHTIARATWMSIAIFTALTLTGCQSRQTAQSSTTVANVYAQNERIQTQLAALSTKVDELSRRVSQLNATAAVAPTRTIVPEPAPQWSQPAGTIASSPPAAPTFTAIAPVTTGSTSRFSSVQPVTPIASQGPTTVRVPGAVLFGSGQTTLNDSGRALVGRISDVINREYPTARVLLEGYADTDPISHSSHEDNVTLSRARAESVRREMIARGVPGASIEAVGRGAVNPKPSKALSRRVEVSVIVR
jgi:outer membrane protein OmpA-like peptidoglycan-associated protein